MAFGRWIAGTLVATLALLWSGSALVADVGEGASSSPKKGKSSKKNAASSTARPLPPASDKTWVGVSDLPTWHDVKQECLDAVKGKYLSAYDAHLQKVQYWVPLQDNLTRQQELFARKQTAIAAMTAELKREPYQAELAARLHDEEIIKDSMAKMLDQRKIEIRKMAAEADRLKQELGQIEAKISKLFVLHLKAASPLVPESIFAELRVECLRFPRVCDATRSPEEIARLIFGEKIHDTFCLEYLQAARTAP